MKKSILPLTYTEWRLLDLMAHHSSAITAKQLQGAGAGSRIYTLLNQMQARGLIEITGRRSGTRRDAYCYRTTRIGQEVHQILSKAITGALHALTERSTVRVSTIRGVPRTPAGRSV